MNSFSVFVRCNPYRHPSTFLEICSLTISDDFLILLIQNGQSRSPNFRNYAKPTLVVNNHLDFSVFEFIMSITLTFTFGDTTLSHGQSTSAPMVTPQETEVHGKFALGTKFDLGGVKD